MITASAATPAAPRPWHAHSSGDTPMSFWQSLKATYSGGTRFLIACPLLVAVPVLVEMIQHMIEIYIGMYDNIAMAEAVENHPLRMGFGLLKMAALLISNYWVIRYMATGDRGFAARLERTAMSLFAAPMLFIMSINVAQSLLFPRDNPWIFAAGFFGGQIIGALIAAWVAGAALDNRAMGPRASLRIMAPNLPFTFALLLLAMLPLTIPHYVLGGLAILGPKMALWPSLIADSLLVGWLSAIMAASGYVGASRAADKAGVSLMPQ